MQRFITISTIGLVLLGATAPTGSAHAASHTGGVNACLRAHGWQHGQRSLHMAELRAGHPNGLIRICGGSEGRALVASGRDRVAHVIVLHRSGTVVSSDPHGTQARYDAQASGPGPYGRVPWSGPPSGRVDRPGATGGAGVAPVSTESAAASSSSSFDRVDAALAAGLATIVALVAGLAVSRARRRGGVAMPS